MDLARMSAVLVTLAAVAFGAHACSGGGGATVRSASSGIDALYRREQSPSHAELERSFLVLVDAPDGAEALRELDDAHAGIAFDETRRTVYFVHSREPGAEGGRSCLGWSFDGTDRGRGEGHAGFPGFLELTGVETEGAAARVRFTVSPGGERFGLEPGAAYEMTVDPWSGPLDIVGQLPQAQRV